MIEYTNEDCMIGMARYPDKYFDLAIIDPPYGIGEKFKGGSSGKMNFNEIVLKEWDCVPEKKYFSELFRVSKNQIIWGGNYFDLPPSRGFVIWRKTTVAESFSMAMCEYAWCSFNSNSKIWDGAPQGTKKDPRMHPTQKPVALYQWLLKNYAKQGDKILDTHVGSASSLIACYDMGFDAVGFELDKDYFDKSTQRLNDFMRQPKLEEVVNSEYSQTSLL